MRISRTFCKCKAFHRSILFMPQINPFEINPQWDSSSNMLGTSVHRRQTRCKTKVWAERESPWDTAVYLRTLLLMSVMDCGLFACMPPKFRCRSQTANVTIFGGRAFGSWLGHEGGVFINGISVLVEVSPVSSLIPLSRHSTKMPSVTQEPGPHQTPDL